MTKRNIIFGILFTATLMSGAVASTPALAAKCAGANTAIIECTGKGETAIFKIIADVIKILTAGIGVLAVGATVAGGLLYTMSGNNPENIRKAKTIWLNTVIGLVAYAFIVALTHFLIPGGVF